MSSRTLTPSSPRNPRDRLDGVVVDERQHLVDGQPALVRDPWGLQAGVGDGDVRVDARAGRGDGVDRHGNVVGEAVGLAVRGVRSSMAARRSGFVGPWFEAPLAAMDRSDGSAGYGSPTGLPSSSMSCTSEPEARAPAAEGRVWKYSGALKALPDERRPDHLAVPLDERAVGLVREQGLGHAGHGQRVEEAAEHGEHEHHAQGGDQLSSHHFTPRAEMTTSMSLMPMNGVMIPPTP